MGKGLCRLISPDASLPARVQVSAPVVWLSLKYVTCYEIGFLLSSLRSKVTTRLLPPLVIIFGVATMRSLQILDPGECVRSFSLILSEQSGILF